MKRVYLYNHIKTGNKILISDEPAHYIKHVLRMNPGSTFCAFDGSGNEYILKIKKISLNAIESEIVEEKYTEEKEPEISIELCLCLCKNKTFENILKKAAEIGVSTIIPIKSAR
ncbi:MAG TPA: RsmE family RNA methyltransferase, partial [bacterium]|nr:RsmE family RNA methyltransferase [bacterium]